MKSAFNYKTDKKRIDKLKALALLWNIPANKFLDTITDMHLANIKKIKEHIFIEFTLREKNERDNPSKAR